MAQDPVEIRRLQKADARLDALKAAASDRAAARRVPALPEATPGGSSLALTGAGHFAPRAMR